MRTLTYVLKRKDEPSKVLSFISGINEVGQEGRDVVGFTSPYYEDGQALLSEGDKTIFDSQKVESPFFELNVLVKDFLEMKAVFLVSQKGSEIREITRKVASISPKKGEPDKNLEEKIKELVNVLLDTSCLYLSIDLDSKLNRNHLEEAKELFYGCEIPVLILRSKKEASKPMPRVVRHKRSASVKDQFDLKKFIKKEWPTACFLTLFPFIGSLSLMIAGALFGEGETGIAALLLILSLFVYGMFVFIGQSLFKSYPTRRGLLASVVASFACAVAGSIISVFLSLVLSSILEAEPFLELMSYSYLGIVIMVASSIILAIWAYFKEPFASIFNKIVKKGR